MKPSGSCMLLVTRWTSARLYCPPWRSIAEGAQARASSYSCGRNEASALVSWDRDATANFARQPLLHGQTNDPRLGLTRRVEQGVGVIHAASSHTIRRREGVCVRRLD